MGEGTPARRRWGSLGIVFVTALLGAAVFSGLNSSSALACSTQDNGGGNFVCTSDQFADECSGGSYYIVVYVPSGAVIDSHQLFPANPVCVNATRTENSFEDNATGNNGDGTFPSPGAGQKAVRVKYTIVCASTCSGTVNTSLQVTYHIPDTGVPVNDQPPAISGTPTVGSVLACNPGTWHGDAPLTPHYQWFRGMTPIPGATGDTYTVQPGDEGALIHCQVTMEDAQHDSSSTSSENVLVSAGGGGSGAAGQTPSPLSADSVQLPAKLPVNPKTGGGKIEYELVGDNLVAVNFDMADAFMYFLGSAVPNPRSFSAVRSAAPKAGVIAATHHSAGQRTIRTTLKLNAKGRQALRRSGKLRVSVRGAVANAAGTTAFVRTLKLVAGK